MGRDRSVSQEIFVSWSVKVMIGDEKGHWRYAEPRLSFINHQNSNVR